MKKIVVLGVLLVGVTISVYAAGVKKKSAFEKAKVEQVEQAEVDARKSQIKVDSKDLEGSLTKWHQANPNATEIEKRAALGAHLDAIPGFRAASSRHEAIGGKMHETWMNLTEISGSGGAKKLRSLPTPPARIKSLTAEEDSGAGDSEARKRELLQAGVGVREAQVGLREALKTKPKTLEATDKQKIEGQKIEQEAQLADVKAGEQATLKKFDFTERAKSDDQRTQKAALKPTEFARAKVSQKALEDNKKELLGAQRMVHKNLSPAQAAKAKDLADEKILTKEKQEEGRKYLKAAGVVVGVGALVGVILGALAAAGVFDEPGAEPAVTPSGIPTEPILTPAAEEPEETGMEVVAGRGSYQFED